MNSTENFESKPTQPTRSLVFSLKFIFISLFVLCNAYLILALFPNTTTHSLSAYKSFFGLIPNNHRDIYTSTKMATAGNDDDESWKTATNIYAFKAKSIDGDEVDLSKYK